MTRPVTRIARTYSTAWGYGKGFPRALPCGTAVAGTADLTAARERFLTAYNGVAKPLIRGLLADLGRADDFALFFLDLQVNERAPRKRAEPARIPETPPAPTN